MTKAPPKDDWTKLEGRISAGDIRRLGSRGAIEKLSLTKMPTLTAKVAQGLSSLQSVDQLWLWCDVTRTAMRHVIAVPGLRTLDILNIVKPGRLESFSAASNLEVFRGNHYLTEEDLLQITTCKSLRELGAQGAEVSLRAIRQILELPKLESLDLEGSEFNDEMAEQISTSTLLTSLDIGATRITRAGLKHLCKMRQLRSLDLWAIASIQESDLDLLTELPNLEYVSVGEYSEVASFNAETLLPRLNAVSSLKRIWLDGVRLDPPHRESLEARYEAVRIT